MSVLQKADNLDPMTRAKALAVEADLREREALRIYRPLPSQVHFHQSLASERIVRGGNRSGKTMSAAAEFASAVTGMPIIGNDGVPLPNKYPLRPMIAWCIGFDQRHIGQTLYRVLFEPGLFMVIRDEKTMKWRMFRPWEPADQLRSLEARPAQPLIPPRLIDPDGWGFEDRANGVFAKCTLKNGTKVFAYPSTGEVKMGDPVDLLWIDEDIRYSGHVAEWQARLSDRKGRMIWSAFPYSKNDALVRMSERAVKEKEIGRNPPFVHEVVLRYSDNPFIDAEEKAKRHAGWSPEEIRARDYGDFMHDAFLMYDFSLRRNGLPSDRNDALDQLFERTRGELPREWTRYLVLDPGHSTTAVLFAAVPPPDAFGYPTVVIEDELYLHKATCDDTAAAIYNKVSGLFYEAFIIDEHAGRQTPMGGAKTIKQQYSEAFAALNLTSRLTGSGFIGGSDNTVARRDLVRQWLRVNPETGHCKVRVVADKTPHMQMEFKLYKKRVTSDNQIKDEPVYGNDHLMNCLEYLAAYNPQYVHPDVYADHGSPIVKFYKDLQKMFKPAQGKGYVHLGPGTSDN